MTRRGTLLMETGLLHGIFSTRGEKYYFHMGGACEMRLKWTLKPTPQLGALPPQSDGVEVIGGRGARLGGGGNLGAGAQIGGGDMRGRWPDLGEWEARLGGRGEQGTDLGVGKQGPYWGQEENGPDWGLGAGQSRGTDGAGGRWEEVWGWMGGWGPGGGNQ